MLQRILESLGIASSDAYRRARPVILVNGLAEQGESWYLNRTAWQKHYEVHSPGVLVYDGPVMQERMAGRLPINIDFLTDRLTEYLDRFVQSPPYHLVASSLGAQISVEYAARHPEKVDKLVLLCPSGFGSVERLPIMEGARGGNYQGLVESTFFNRRCASPRIVKYYEQKFASKPWRRAAVRNRAQHQESLGARQAALFDRPTLVICGREDRIVDPHAVYEAVKDIPNYRFVMVPHCGHAPQLECSRLINRMVVEFLDSDAAAA